MTSEIRLWSVPVGAALTTCRGCSARIVWGKTDKGKSVPLSIDSPHAHWLEADGRNRECVEAPSHFTDCPAANQFSRKSRH